MSARYEKRTLANDRSAVIALAREAEIPQLLPSAFYDLSRYLPSQLAIDYTDPDTNRTYTLSNNDLFRVYRGKEQAARYFSTFIVKELEGLDLITREADPNDRRAAVLRPTEDGLRRLEDVRSGPTGGGMRRDLAGWDLQDIRQFADLLHRFTQERARRAD